jgi:NAD(P)H-flavin reductase
MWPWTKKPPVQNALQVEVGQHVQLTLPGGKQREYVLNFVSFSQGGRKIGLELMTEDLVRERYEL